MLIQITTSNAGGRLDGFLKRHFDAEGLEVTRSQITNAINGGRITLNGEIVKAGRILRKGDQIDGDLYGSDAPAEPEEIPLNIVYEDEYLLIINKPRGMVVHPGAGVRSGTLLNGLLWHLKKFGDNSLERAGIVHRLDKNTSGLMVVAKNAKVQATLAKMFEYHDVKRTYHGLVEGRIDQSGTVNKNIIRHPGVRTLYTTTDRAGEGRTAITHYKPLAVYKTQSNKVITLVEFKLETGRTHQIRVHMKSLNRPLVGDPEYNPASSLKASGQLLEAIRLEFTHPITGKAMNSSVEYSDEFSHTLKKLSKMS